MDWKALGVCVLLWFASPIQCQAGIDSADAAPHEKYVRAAWTAFEKHEFAKAIAHAQECIREFQSDARQVQESLRLRDSQVPLGQVSDAEKQIIQKNGVLNDVATCLYIKGRAATQLSEADVAQEAFEALGALPDARTWDERGWFWSPLDAAKRFVADPKRADEPPHAAYVAAAWDAFNQADYRATMDATKRCVEQFYRGALLAEESLRKSGAGMPTGVVDETMKAQILKNGLLNDVATCLWLEGRSAEKIGDEARATDAYRKAKTLTFGRTWDPKGWFWTPSTSAAQLLETID